MLSDFCRQLVAQIVYPQLACHQRVALQISIQSSQEICHQLFLQTSRSLYHFFIHAFETADLAPSTWTLRASLSLEYWGSQTFGMALLGPQPRLMAPFNSLDFEKLCLHFQSNSDSITTSP